MQDEQQQTDLKMRIDALMRASAWDEAEQALQSLLVTEPDCPPAYAKLGVVHLRMGDFRTAERHFLHAARRMPNMPNSFDGLAEAYGHLGQIENARQAGRRARC